MINVEGDIINFFPIRHNRNAYPRKEKNCGDDSIMVIIDDKNLGNTIITGNIDLSRNIIMYSRDLVLSFIHIGIHTGDEKYRTKSRKPKTFKNITIKIFTERIESYTILEVTDIEGAINLLINIKYIVIAADTI